jgi:hypothetical protein
MTAYVMAASGTLRDVGNAAIWGVATARAGGDTIDTNGFTVTQDQDSRYGLSGTTSTTWGNITINASKGGSFIVDARKVMMIPFSTGVGTLTLGTAITVGSATCNTIGIYTALNVAPATTGVSGWLKVTNWNGVAFPTSGVIVQAGLTFTITGAAIQGFIEVNGDESAGFIANRLGAVKMYGAWFSVGSTSGVSTTTYQLPTNGGIQYYPAVWVDSDPITITGASWSGGIATYTSSAGHKFHVGEEVTTTGATPSGYNVTDTVITARTATTFSIAMAADPGAWSSGGLAVVPEAYPCAGSLVVAASTATDVRGKCHWSSTAGVLRFGSDGTNTVGYLPSSGRRIRIPNILTANNTTASRTANVLPNATLATRFDWTTTGGGVTDIDKALLNWYPSQAQAYAFNAKYCGIASQLSLSEVAQAMTLVQVCVGQEAAATQTALTMNLCFAGGTINSCVWTRATLATAVFINTLSDVAGFTFNNNRSETRVLKANSGAGAWNATRSSACTWVDDVVTGAKNMLTTCFNLSFTNTHYRDVIVGTTVATGAQNNSVWELATNCTNVLLDGLDFSGIANVHPYTSLLSINAAGCTNIKLRNIGTYAAPLSLGSANACGLIYSLATGAAASDVKIQRVYCANTRTGIMTGDNSSTRILQESVFGDYADGIDVGAVLNYTRKGIGGTLALTAQTAVYGTHWADYHTSATVSRIAITMNETTALTAALVVLTGGAGFTSAGGLYMPRVGMSATFETPNYIIGHTGFTNTALVMAGGTATNYTYEYSIDKNDGAGYSTLTTSAYTETTLGTALSGITGISAVNGFKLKLKITTGTANTTAITSVYLTTASTTTTQAYQYPLDTVPVTVTVKDGSTLAVVAGVRVRIITVAGGNAVLSGVTDALGVVTGTTQYTEAVSGYARRATTGLGTLYKSYTISATVGVAGLDLTVLLTRDE